MTKISKVHQQINPGLHTSLPSLLNLPESPLDLLPQSVPNYFHRCRPTSINANLLPHAPKPAALLPLLLWAAMTAGQGQAC
eukprot:498882-Pelagomonas_calceolata.AAC.1